MDRCVVYCSLMANLFLFAVALHATSCQFKLKDRRFSVLIPCSSEAGQSSIQCVGICASTTQSFCQKLGNSSMLDVYPPEYKQCAGSKGFVGTDKAPDSYCSLGYSRLDQNLFEPIANSIMQKLLYDTQHCALLLHE